MSEATATISAVEAMQLVTDELRRLQRDSDHLGGIRATLIVNYGPDGRGRHSGLVDPDDRVEKSMINVLGHLKNLVAAAEAERDALKGQVEASRQQLKDADELAIEFDKLVARCAMLEEHLASRQPAGVKSDRRATKQGL